MLAIDAHHNYVAMQRQAARSNFESRKFVFDQVVFTIKGDNDVGSLVVRQSMTMRESIVRNPHVFLGV